MQNQSAEFDHKIEYAGSFTRSCASAIDMFIANTIRVIVFSILGSLWFGKKVLQFQAEFKAKFGVDVIGKSPEQLEFLSHHPIFNASILFFTAVFLSGAIYYIAFNASSWNATIGKKIMKIMVIKTDGEKLNFLESTAYYFLSLVPWLFIVYILIYQLVNGVNIYNAIVHNPFNLIFGLITLAWLQIHLITKKKTTAHDLICKTIVVKIK